MKKSLKFSLLGIGLFAGVIALSGCTASFTKPIEKARIIAAYEPGVSEFYNDAEASTIVVEEGRQLNKIEDNIWQYAPANNYDVTKIGSSTLQTINSSAFNAGVYVPSIEYFNSMDVLTLKKAIEASGLTEYNHEQFAKVLEDYGYLKYYVENNEWNGFNANVETLKNDLGWEKCPTADYIKLYKNQFDSIVKGSRATITIFKGKYGTYGDNNIGVEFEKTTWGYAWQQGGFLIEGLIVFPVVWMLDSFANIFAGGVQANLTGVPQLLSLLVVTVIVRLFLFLVTIKSTLSQQKMTSLQPELAKIQQKYPNSNTNQSQKQRMAEEQMRLYKKHGVNPLSSLLVLIVQFPIFIGVWGAMTGAAVLSTGQVMGLNLSASIWNTLTNKALLWSNGWWTALGLILLMSAGQFFSMKVPQWIQKAQTKKVSRLTKNPAEKSQNRTANIISYVMLIMIIIMGFTLPAAMGVYWFVGALISLAQTLIMNLISSRKKNKSR